MEKSMNSLKAAMVIIVLGLAGLFASCSSDSANTIDPITPSAQEQAQQQTQKKADVAKVKLTCTYMFADSVLDYVDAKVIYTDASGKEQTQAIEKSNCTNEKDSLYKYKLELDAANFPANMTAKLEVTPKQEAIDNAKTGTKVLISRDYGYVTYDKDGKQIDSKVILTEGVNAFSGKVQLTQDKMKGFLVKMLEAMMRAQKLDKTLTFSVDSSANITHDVK